MTSSRGPGGSGGGSEGGSGGSSASGLISISASLSSRLLRPGASKPEPWGRSPVLPGLTRPVPHNLGVDGAADAVGELGVQLGQLVAGVHAGVGDVPHGGGLHDVPDHKLLDGLVLGAGLGAVGATDELDMTAAVLVTSSVPPFRCHVTSLAEVNQAIL